jgi:DICT domain-containing protein/signal transduction histidine kinase
MYFKSSLTALSHAMEDQVLAGSDQPLVIASFQKERFYRQEAHRYRRIGEQTPQVYVLAAPETKFENRSGIYETVAFETTDALTAEWHLVVIGKHYASCLICRERAVSRAGDKLDAVGDNSRRFEGIWTFERETTKQAARILLDRILEYRPPLAAKIEQAKKKYLEAKENYLVPNINCSGINPEPFVQRLVAYLQAGHYKLLKANRSIMAKEERERLLNSVTAAIRRSLNAEEILQVAVEKLGQGLGVCRCLVYRCKENDSTTKINHEFISKGNTSIKGQTWLLKKNPLFQEAVELREALSVDNTFSDPRIFCRGDRDTPLQTLVQSCSISSWLLVPILYQDSLLGMLELHHCSDLPVQWKSEDIALVNAIATQVGVALIQAEAYTNLEKLNRQLEALDRTRSNLVAITGHELRTPLSTIQVCLESLANEPDMVPELRDVMLNTALDDAERMRKLVQDFLTLSQLESGRIEWHPEPVSLFECAELAMSHMRSLRDSTREPRDPSGSKVAKIINLISPELPLVQADGEWLVEVLTKLLDNACKFTEVKGTVTIDVNTDNSDYLEVTVADTGRGIEPNRLETVFDRFYQEEGALRRSSGGTGLGLAICRQIVNGWGGTIWAESVGKNQGSKFHFTVPTIFSAHQSLTKTDQSLPTPAARKTTRRKGQREKKI